MYGLRGLVGWLNVAIIVGNKAGGEVPQVVANYPLCTFLPNGLFWEVLSTPPSHEALAHSTS